MNNIGLLARLDNIKKKMTMEKNEDLKKQKEELIETMFAVDKNEEIVEVTNSEIFSLKEWKSWSKERQESVILLKMLKILSKKALLTARHLYLWQNKDLKRFY